MLKSLVVWSFVCCVIKTECLESPLTISSTFDFNKTIEDVISLSNNVDGLIDELKKILETLSNSKYDYTDPVAAAITFYESAFSLLYLTIQEATYADAIIKDTQDCDEQEKRQLEDDDQFKHLISAEENAIKFFETFNNIILNVTNEIPATIIKGEFEEKVTTPLLNFFSFFKAMIHDVLNDDNVSNFIDFCNDTNPFSIINNMVEISDSLFNSVFKQNEYDEKKFFSVVILYYAITNQFVRVYPHCSILAYRLDAMTSNLTSISAIVAVDNCLKKAAFERSKLFTKSEFILPLFNSVRNDNKEDNALAFYNILMSTAAGLERFLSQKYAYMVIVNQAFNESAVVNISNIEYEYTTFDDVELFKIPILSGNCTSTGNGWSNPAPSCVCDANFSADELCTQHAQSSDKAGSVIQYVNDHCHYSFLHTFSFGCEEPPKSCSSPGMESNTQFEGGEITCGRTMINFVFVS